MAVGIEGSKARRGWKIDARGGIRVALIQLLLILLLPHVPYGVREEDGCRAEQAGRKEAKEALRGGEGAREDARTASVAVQSRIAWGWA